MSPDTPQRPTRVAVVDIGTNTTRLLIADVAGGRLETVVRRSTVTTLGQGVDRDGRLAEEALDRVRAAVTGYAEEVDRLGADCRIAVATSAVRDAANGEELLTELSDRFGFPARLLSGREEAEATFAGVTAGRPLAQGTLVIDIGGGSTELTIGGPEGVEWTTSLQLGGVRMTERFLHGDPPTASEVGACAAHVRSLLPALEPTAAVGVAGTVTTLAALDLGLESYDPSRVHGHVVAADAVERWAERLLAMTVAERRELPCMEHGRAPVIGGGLVTLREILRRYGLDELSVSESDILDGTALLVVRDSVA